MARQTRKQTRRTARTARMTSILSLLGIIALLVFSVTPALAHHKADHTHGGGNDNASAASDHDGDADSDASDTQTEDDADPRENTAEGVSDAGDNRHPSGKDRSVESGGSASNPNQGKAESNPDDSKGPMRYEAGLGDDKPNGPGGMDAADQDGNNGCGNDDDFDDDNNGHCGKPVEEDEVLASIEVCPIGTDNAGMPLDQVKRCNEDEVLAHTDFAKPKLPTEVLNETLRRAVPVAGNSEVLGAVLPFTGGSVSYLAAAALGLIALGTLALSLKSRTNE